MNKTADQQHFDMLGFVVKRRLFFESEMMAISGELDVAMRAEPAEKLPELTGRKTTNDWVRRGVEKLDHVTTGHRQFRRWGRTPVRSKSQLFWDQTGWMFLRIP